jgi:hypothetical protein
MPKSAQNYQSRFAKGGQPWNCGLKGSRQKTVAAELPKTVRLTVDMNQKVNDTCSVGVQPMTPVSHSGYRFLRPKVSSASHVDELSQAPKSERYVKLFNCSHMYIPAITRQNNVPAIKTFLALIRSLRSEQM